MNELGEDNVGKKSFINPKWNAKEVRGQQVSKSTHET